MALEQNIMIYHSVRKTEVRELSQQRALQRFLLRALMFAASGTQRLDATVSEKRK